ncbi:MAG: PAS domain S-box protein [Jaaginema sp. PMC 1079.18]|nr:PAS domain S-box protein [Jaaginema sp. PMC 1080.18]MEC4851703.1 PAS domain S-box protein [Jaaginema sp. PMC 1079.18]MEC4865050.1 PAS domain S-box protein [Jaaginema sp. PMC 1078.18]
MRDEDKTKDRLIEECKALRQRVTHLEAIVSNNASAAQILQESQALYRNILDNTVAGFFQITPDRQYQVANLAMAQLLGYSSPLELIESVKDIKTEVFVNPQKYEECQRLLKSQGEVKEFEYQAYRRDGMIIWISDNIRVVRDDKGAMVYFEGNSIDISDRVAMEEELERQVQERTAALKESNDFLVEEVVQRFRSQHDLRATKVQLKAILEAVPGIVSCVSSDLRYLGVNQSLARIFNLSPEEFVGQDIGFLGSGSEFSRFIRRFFASSQQEDACEFTVKVEGETQTYIVVAQKYADSQAAFTVGIDVTQRRLAERRLREAKDQLQAILEAVPGIVSWISSDLRYLGVNRHLAGLYGIRPEAFVNKDIGFLGTGSEFNRFVRDFFTSPHSDSYREVSAQVQGKPKNYLVVAQKYDRDRAAFIVGIDITERKQAEKALLETEARYRSIFENAIEGIYQISPDGCYLSANPALARIYGYKSPQALIANLTHRDPSVYVDFQKRDRFLKLLQKRDRVLGFEVQICRQDGQKTWISENARAVRNEQGHLLYYEGTVEDITERQLAQQALQKANEELESRVSDRTAALRESNDQLIVEIAERRRIEQALRTSEAELRALFAAMTDIITVFDAQGRYVRVVSTNSEVLYSPTEDRIGKSVYEVLNANEADFFVAEIQRVINTQKTVNIEYSLIVEEGETNPQEIWFAASVSPMPDNCVIWVARNITERKRMLDALSQAEAKYRSIFENAAEGIFQIDPQKGFLSANPALVKMYGYESAEAIRTQVQDIAEQLYVDPQRRYELLDLLEGQDAVYHYESEVYRQDKSIIWISENVRAVRDDTGKILYYEGTVDDITQRKEAELALYLEQEKSERLLLNILPRAIADQLKQYQGSLAERFDEATVLFADIVGFTPLSARISPLELVSLLNQIFSAFDKLADKHGLEKIKTIGDAYMVAGGLPVPNQNHAEAIAAMALEMQQEVQRFRSHLDKPFEIRIGINTGPVVAGVIGIKKFIYDLWGDTVNVASRMESQGEAGRIQVTAQTYERLKDRYNFCKRGQIFVKGKGEMIAYWLESKKETP